MIVYEMAHIRTKDLMKVYDNDGYGMRVNKVHVGKVGTCTYKGCKRLALVWSVGLSKLSFFSIFMLICARILITLSLYRFVAIIIVLSRLIHSVTKRLNLFYLLLMLILTYFFGWIINH